MAHLPKQRLVSVTAMHHGITLGWHHYAAPSVSEAGFAEHVKSYYKCNKVMRIPAPAANDAEMVYIVEYAVGERMYFTSRSGA